MASLIRQSVRQSSGLSTSLEGFDISLEEDQLLAQEQQEENHEAEVASDEVEQLQDQAETMSDTAQYLDETVNARADADPENGGATETEVALAQQVAASAASAAGDDAENVMPAAENFVGGKVSTEGMKETVRGWVRAIIEAIKRVWDKVKSIWRKMTSRLGGVKKRAADLKARAKKASGQSTKEKKVKLSGTIAGMLSVDGAVKRSYGDIHSAFKTLSDITEKSVNDWAGAVAGAGDKIEKIVSDLDMDKAADELQNKKSTFEGIAGGLLGKLKLSGSSDKRYAESEVDLKSSDAFLGDKRIFAKQRSTKGSSALDALRDIASLRVFVAPASDKTKDHSETEFDIWQPSQVETICDEIITLCESLHKYAEGKGLSDIEKVRGKIETQLRKKESQTKDDTKPADASAFRAVVGACYGFVDWSRNPQTSMALHAVAEMNTIMAVGSRSLSQYA